MLELRLLGPFEARLDSRVVPLRPKQKALLTVLALHAGEAVSVDRLVDDLWGGRPPATATASLQNAVSLVRRTLRDDVVVTRPPGYALAPSAARVDVLDFERLLAEAREAGPADRAARLTEALALWRGPALADLAFEPFAEVEAARLEELRASAREDLAEAELGQGRHAELVGELEQLVAEQPFRERPRALLMLALYRAGRQADALEAYQDARRFLVEELGLEPSPALRTLQQAMLRQDPALDPPEAPSYARLPGEERRATVTVVFCDVVDSTSLGAALDPEAYRNLLRRYYRAARSILERHGGRVEKFVGDAVLGVFGVPERHEDDALRAVRAASELQASLVTLNEELKREHGVAIGLRVGVNTGEVLVGEPEFGHSFATGHALNVAAKLQQSAAAGETLVGAATLRLVQDAVRSEPAPPLELGGAAAPVAAFRILEVGGGDGVARNLSAPLVGREPELEALREAWEHARDERGCRVVSVVGEAGIGKTRLARELAGELDDAATVLVGRCVSYGEGATYLPVAEVLRSVVADASEAGLAAAMADVPEARLVARRLRELIGLEEGNPPPGEGFWAVRRFLEEQARARPVLLVLDDVHWAEPTLLELVDHLAEQVTDAPLLVLCLARELQPSGEQRALVQLDRLSDDESARLLDNLAGVPAETRSRIVATAEGNALFVEQLHAYAVEAGGEALAAVPPTVDALLASRLDRLPESERAVLERAAVVGREFWRGAVDALSERSTRAELEALILRGLVRPTRSTLDAEEALAFHHVLIRDVAYAGVTKERRSKLHERVAAWLDERDPGWDEVVGYHLEQAYWLRLEVAPGEPGAAGLAAAGGTRLANGGVRAWKRTDVAAAVNLLTRAAALLGVSEQRADVLCELSLALMTGGETALGRERLEEALAVAETVGSRRAASRARVELAYAALYGVGGLTGTASELLETAAAAIPVLEELGDDRALGRTWFAVAEAQNMLLNNRARGEASATALKHYRRAGFSPSVCFSGQAAALYYGSTPVPQALRRCEELIADADGDRQATASILMFAAGLRAMRKQVEQAREDLNRAQATFEEHGAAFSLAGPVLAFRAIVELSGGNALDAERLLRESRERLLEMEFTAAAATRSGQLADLMYEQGRLDEAEDFAALMERDSGEDDLTNAADWRRIHALLLARRGAATEAEAMSREAVALLADTDALNQRARAMVGLAEVLAILDSSDGAASELVEEALRLYRRKGNLTDAARVRTRLARGALTLT